MTSYTEIKVTLTGVIRNERCKHSDDKRLTLTEKKCGFNILKL